MKKFLTGLGAFALVLILALGVTGCGNNGGGGGQHRTPVADGTFTATGWGYSWVTPITVATTFLNNQMIRIAVTHHAETAPILDTVVDFFIPRAIYHQSIGVDLITGATLSNLGVVEAIEAAITEAGGNPFEWMDVPTRRTGTRTIPQIYDVIVVGIGGAGMTAYIAATQRPNTSVLGLEAAAKVGGNTATAGGPFVLGATALANFYGHTWAGGATIELIRDQWLSYYGNQRATQIDGLDLTYPAAAPPYSLTGSARYPGFPYLGGGPKTNIVWRYLQETGPTIDMLFQAPYNMNFQRPGASHVANWGTDRWLPGGGGNLGTGQYGNDDTLDVHKTVMFNRVLETARRRNRFNDIRLEMRATNLSAPTENRPYYIVTARYRNGITYQFRGRTVIMATGGFVASREMTERFWGRSVNFYALSTHQGDGIRMGLEVGAATYNAKMPGMAHIGQVPNVVRARIDHPLVTDANMDRRWKATLTNLMLKDDNLNIARAVGMDGVDRRGQRWTNEALRFPGTAQAPGGPADGTTIGAVDIFSWRAGGHYAAIFSDNILEDIRVNGTRTAGAMRNPFWITQHGPGDASAFPHGQPITPLWEIINWGVATGNVVRAPNLAGLAQQLGVDVTVLQNTILQYNRHVRGEEACPFGRLAATLTTEISENWDAPFTAILGSGHFYASTGGLDIDEYMRVLGRDQVVIPGLYATGQDSMGVIYHGKMRYGRHSGIAKGWALVSGRLAGMHAAQTAEEMRAITGAAATRAARN